MSRTIQYLDRFLKTTDPLCWEQYNIYTVPKLAPYCRFPSTNNFDLPGCEKSTKSQHSIVDKRLSQPFLTKLKSCSAISLWTSKVIVCIWNINAQSLSEDGSDHYHGTKSTILQRIEKMWTPTPPSESSAIIIELNPLFWGNNYSVTFFEFALSLFNDICRIS